MTAIPSVPGDSRNPHWQAGESSADHARRRGWEPGTRLVGDAGYGPTTITITALGRAAVLAVTDGRGDETLWALAERDWQPEGSSR